MILDGRLADLERCRRLVAEAADLAVGLLDRLDDGDRDNREALADVAGWLREAARAVADVDL